MKLKHQNSEWQIIVGICRMIVATHFTVHTSRKVLNVEVRHDTNPSSSAAVIKPHLSVKFSIPGEYMQRDAVNS